MNRHAKLGNFAPDKSSSMAERSPHAAPEAPKPKQPKLKQPRRQQPEVNHEWWIQYKLDETAVVAEAQRRIEHKLLGAHTKACYGETCPTSTADFESTAAHWPVYGYYAACSRLLSLDGVASFQREAHERYLTGTYMVRQAAREKDRRDYRAEQARYSQVMVQRREKAAKNASQAAERELSEMEQRPDGAAALYFLDELPQQGLPVISATF